MDGKTKGNLAVGIGVFIFGINFVSMKFLVDHMPNFSLIFFRFAIASIFLFIIDKIRIYRGNPKQKIKQDDKILVAVTGFLGIAIFYIFQSLSLRYINASLAALICAMIPIFTLLSNVIIYRRKLDLFLGINFIVAIIGVFLVLDIQIGNAINPSELIGCILMFLAVLSWIAYTIKTYELQKEYDSIYLLYKQTSFGAIFLLVTALFDISKAVEVFQQGDILIPLIGNLIFVGTICSALGYLLYIYGMEKIGVEISSLYMNLIPAITAIVSYLFLNETMSAKKIVGIIIVIISLYAVGLRDWLRNKKEANRQGSAY